MGMCGCVRPSNRITSSIVIDTTLTATTIIQFLKSRSTIRTVDFSMSTAAPQFFPNAHDITMINPVISNYQYLGGASANLDYAITCSGALQSAIVQ
jgi:hypothetical protein